MSKGQVAGGGGRSGCPRETKSQTHTGSWITITRTCSQSPSWVC